jgi:hypothetical protein
VSWRKTLVLALVLTILGGLYLWDRDRIEKGKAKEEEEKKLFPWTAEQVTEVTVQRPSGPLHLVRGDKGEWLIEAPVRTPADGAQVKGFLDALLRARRERKISDDVADLQPYGLSRPETTITLKGHSPEGDRELELGNKNPTEVYYYARMRGEKTLFLISDTIRREAARDLFELRNKSLLTLALGRVQGVEISTAEKRVTLRREGESGWRITEPMSLPADGDAIDSFLFRLSRLRAVAFEDAPSKPLAEMGLAPPSKRVVVRLKDPEEERTLLLGSEEPGTGDATKPRMYSQVEGISAVALVEKQSLGDVPAVPEDWRTKALLSFDREKVNRVELRHPDGLLSVKKMGSNLWEIEAPERLPADTMKVNDLLWTLKDGRVEQFLTGESPVVSWDNPRVQVSVWSEGAKEPATLTVAGPTPEERGFYARSSAQEEVVVVAPKLVEELKKSSADQLRDKRMVNFDVPKIQRVQVIWEGRNLELVKKGEMWRMRVPQEEDVEAQKVSGFLWSVREARFEEILTQAPGPSVTGRDEPYARVTLWTEGKDPVASLTVGKEVQERPGRRYAWTGEGSPVYAIDGKVTEEMGRDLKTISSVLTSGDTKR